MRTTLLSFLLLAGAAVAQPNDAPPEKGSASDNGRVEQLPPRPLQAADDPVNRHVLAQSGPGLLLQITIDGSAITLDQAQPAWLPRRQMRAQRADAGDVVRVRALAAGRELARSVVPDTVLNALEGGGLVRTERRQISLVLLADEPIDSVEVEALATNARATLDTRAAYARLCEADKRWCPRPR